VDGLPGLHPHARFYRFGFKTWAYSPQIAKIGNFWYIFATKGHVPLNKFFYKIWHGEGLPGPHNHANFHLCGFINVALRPQKSPRNVWYKFAPKKKSSGP